jgi:hypothetical protein
LTGLYGSQSPVPKSHVPKPSLAAAATRPNLNDTYSLMEMTQPEINKWAIHTPQLFQRFRTAAQIYTFKLIFNTLVTLSHPWYFGCSYD